MKTHINQRCDLASQCVLGFGKQTAIIRNAKNGDVMRSVTPRAAKSMCPTQGGTDKTATAATCQQLWAYSVTKQPTIVIVSHRGAVSTIVRLMIKGNSSRWIELASCHLGVRLTLES
jgi:hypothetical protein